MRIGISYADAFAEEKKKTMEAGMNEHLSKPIEPQVLYRTLSKLLFMQNNKNIDENH